MPAKRYNHIKWWRHGESSAMFMVFHPRPPFNVVLPHAYYQRDPASMKTNPTPPDYKGFRFPSEMISHAVRLSFRFSLRYRDVEELLTQRGIVVSYETGRQW